MDLNLLRTAVFEKTGIKIDTQDPIFALVALHETVLAESVAHQLNLIDDATARLQQQSSALLTAAEQVRNLLVTAGHAIDVAAPDGTAAALDLSPAPAPLRPAAPGSAALWFGLPAKTIFAACALAVCTVVLTLCAQWLLFFRSH